MTHRQQVLKLLQGSKEMSCNELCQEILSTELFANSSSFRYRVKNLNASLSGTLNRMVARGEIEIDPSKGGIRHGKVYKLK